MLTRRVEGGWVDGARIVHDTKVHRRCERAPMRYGQHHIPRRRMRAGPSVGVAQFASAQIWGPELRACGDGRLEVLGRYAVRCQHGSRSWDANGWRWRDGCGAERALGIPAIVQRANPLDDQFALLPVRKREGDVGRTTSRGQAHARSIGGRRRK